MLVSLVINIICLIKVKKYEEAFYEEKNENNNLFAENPQKLSNLQMMVFIDLIIILNCLSSCLFLYEIIKLTVMKKCISCFRKNLRLL